MLSLQSSSLSFHLSSQIRRFSPPQINKKQCPLPRGCPYLLPVVFQMCVLYTCSGSELEQFMCSHALPGWRPFLFDCLSAGLWGGKRVHDTVWF